MAVKVNVFKPADRKFYQVCWIDPDTGKQRWKSAGTQSKRDAERFAAKLEKEINEGMACGGRRARWEDFRLRYEQEVIAGLADETDRKAGVIFDAVERLVKPTYVDQVNEKAIGRVVKHLRDAGRAESTIQGYLRYIKAGLRWAASQKLIGKAPTIRMPKRAKSAKMMKGRPITGEEFERMLAATPKVVAKHLLKRRTVLVAQVVRAEVAGLETGTLLDAIRDLDRKTAEVVESWRFLMTGLLLSGLRLGEALDLWWDRDDRLSVDFTGKYPMLRISAEAEKGQKDRLLPIVREFAELLEAVDDKTGRVFNPLLSRRHGERMRLDTVSRKITEIGQRAQVIVQSGQKPKYASAHDLRRAFGERWAMKVMPTVLQQLMRHESIETTLKYYVGRNAQAVAETVWNAGSVSTFISTANSPETADDVSADSERV